jgi:glucose/mannose-6-phosphate isomerase
MGDMPSINQHITYLCHHCIQPMKELIETFAGQIEKGIAIFDSQQHKVISGNYQHVVISGLGGSGIGGTIIRDLSSNLSNTPVLVNKDYSIPAFVGSETLFIASSYSGDTEETLSATEQALQKGASVICITSGGKLAEMAKKHGLDCLMIPGGSPPRANLGYSLTQLICIFVTTGLLTEKSRKDLEKVPGFLRKKENDILQKAATIAKTLLNKKVVIYSDASHEGVAVRFRQQLNENSKILCWHHVVPEMNHNELVGWTESSGDLAVIFLRNSTDHQRNQHRIEINKSIIQNYASSISEIWGEGENEIERVMYLIHLVDWISYFLAELRGVDIMDIKVIDLLKKKLSEID